MSSGAEQEFLLAGLRGEHAIAVAPSDATDHEGTVGTGRGRRFQPKRSGDKPGRGANGGEIARESVWSDLNAPLVRFLITHNECARLAPVRLVPDDDRLEAGPLAAVAENLAGSRRVLE
jgi:hypothetical protein